MRIVDANDIRRQLMHGAGRWGKNSMKGQNTRQRADLYLKRPYIKWGTESWQTNKRVSPFVMPRRHFEAAVRKMKTFSATNKLQ